MAEKKERLEAFKKAADFERERTVQVEGALYLNRDRLKELLQIAGFIPEDDGLLSFTAHFGNREVSENDQLQIQWRECDA